MIILTFILGLFFGFVLCLICNKRIYAYFNEITGGMKDIKKAIEELEFLDEKGAMELLEEMYKLNNK